MASEDFMSRGVPNAISKIEGKQECFKYVFSERGSAAVCINDGFPIGSPIPSESGIIGSHILMGSFS